MSKLPPIRRIITDHSPDGKAIFGPDETLIPANPVDASGAPPPEGSLIPGFTTVFRATGGYPVDAQGPWTDYHGKMQGLVGNDAVVCRIVDFPTMPENVPDFLNFMHRTDSVDYGVILEGEIDLILDDGATKRMKKGDIVVQRATNHLWKNTSGAPCRVLFVLVPAKPIKVETTGEILQPTDTTHLQKEEAAKALLAKHGQDIGKN